jgi:hypothetical protein
MVTLLGGVSVMSQVEIKSVKIGHQVWMEENLSAPSYNEVELDASMLFKNDSFSVRCITD